ncbi:MAG TPA: hypothetical protein VGR61_05630 [Candidatus Dormibacteraeota bacterium]|nr:hypothetical protein [Candidatus Dormibacteraeota bacterium]
MMLKKFLRTAMAALPLVSVAAPLGMVRVASADITISPDTFTEPVIAPNCAPGHALGKCT